MTGRKWRDGKMRLICPNCEAQYEVPDGAIPEDGRDVQCSNCAHTWFQAHPDAAVDPEDAAPMPGGAGAEWSDDEADEPEPEAPAEMEDAPAEAAEAGAATVADADVEDAAVEEDDAPAAEASDATGGEAPPPEDLPDAPEDPVAPGVERADDHPDATVGSDSASDEPVAPAAAAAPASPVRPEAPAREPRIPPAPERGAEDRAADDDARPVSGTAAPAPDADAENPAPEEQPEPQAAPVRTRPLDPETLEVLRSEAAWEARHRAAEGGPLESQPELGLDEATPASDRGRSRAAGERPEPERLDPTERARRAAASTGDVGGRGRYDRDDDAELDVVPADQGSRSGLFPDVDEINQTLRSSEERRKLDSAQGRAAAEEEDEAARAGFGRGFTSMLLLAVAMIAIYVFAGQIAAVMPAVAAELDAYVTAVDSARAWLDAQVTTFLVWLDGLSAEATVES